MSFCNSDNKSILFFFALIFFAQITYSQDKRDIGLQLGSTYYYGDFNENQPLNSPSVGFGVLFRYNINNHYSIRASALYSNISGSYPTDKYLPDVAKSSFSKQYIDAKIMGEFNFIPFNPINVRKGNLSPFVNLGIGIQQIGGTFVPAIPFGAGLKFSPGGRHTFALEWQFHKTFTDKIDDYTPPTDGKSVIMHNNDWVSFIGLTYTYRLFNSNICPVYK